MVLKKDQKVCVIVPFYNEEQTVERVASSLVKCELIDELIFVDDGSTDNSTDKLSPFLDKIKLIKSESNGGKGSAVSLGVESTDCEIVIFIDADLEGINSSHLEKIAKPLLEGSCDWVLGYPMDTWIDPFFKEYGGQRGFFRKDLLPLLDEFKNSRRYGLEVVLNESFKVRKVKKIPLKGLGHLTKPQKRNKKDFVEEFIVWAVDVGRQLLKMKLIESDEYKALIKIKDSKTIKSLKEDISKLNYGNLKKRLYPYLNALLEIYSNLYENKKNQR